MSRTLRAFGVLFLVLAPATTAPLVAGEPVFRSYEGTQRILVDEPMQASSFPDIALAFATPAYSTDGGLVNFLDCRAVSKRDGRVARGVSIRLDPEIIALDDGEVVRDLPAKTRTLGPFGLWSFALPDVSDLFPGEELPSLGIVVEGDVSGGVNIDELRLTCAGKNRRRCATDGNTICSGGNGRFQVTTTWNNGFQSGEGGVFRRTGLGGEFFFFSESFPELLVKVLNGCQDNGHFWVFYSSTTSVGWELTVTDTQSGETQQYTNPLGNAAPAITDTAAFATCP